MPHHVTTMMVVPHHVTAHVAMSPHAVTAALTLGVVHADVDDAGRGIGGADHAGSGQGRSSDADGSERGKGGDCENGLPHGGFLNGC